MVEKRFQHWGTRENVKIREIKKISFTFFCLFIYSLYTTPIYYILHSRKVSNHSERNTGILQ